MAVTDPNDISPGSSNPIAPLRSAIDYLRQQFAGAVPLTGTTITGTTVNTTNLTVTGTATFAAASIALSALNVKIGWIRWKDVAGTITITGTGGNITLSVGFRTGTAAGDYTLTSGTAFANSNWFMGGITDDSVNQSFIDINGTNVLHSTTQLNFTTIARGAGTLMRPADSLLFAIGA